MKELSSFADWQTLKKLGFDLVRDLGRTFQFPSAAVGQCYGVGSGVVSDTLASQQLRRHQMPNYRTDCERSIPVAETKPVWLRPSDAATALRIANCRGVRRRTARMNAPSAAWAALCSKVNDRPTEVVHGHVPFYRKKPRRCSRMITTIGTPINHRMMSRNMVSSSYAGVRWIGR